MLVKVLTFLVSMLYFVKVQSMHVLGIFPMKSNIFELIKCYAI